MNMRFSNDCNDERMCNKCNLIDNENKEFEANLNLKERQPPNHLVISFLVLKNRMIYL